MKRSLKRTIMAAAACIFILAMLPAAALAADGTGHWAAEYVQSAVDNGWIEDGSVSPSQALTRGEFAVILWKALGSPDAQGANPFTDVAEEEQAAAVAALADLGVADGTGSSTYSPDATLTRQEGIAMLARAFDLTAENKDAAASYSDWADVDDWAQDAIAATVEKGIVDGVGDNRLAPKSNITLGEMAKLTVVAYGQQTAGLQAVSADDAIESVSVIGFVGIDGSKPRAIVVEYNIDLTGAVLGTGSFDLEDYGLTLSEKDLDSGSNPGKPLKAYVNNEAATSENGGSGTGNYVIIELNTEYTVSRFPRSWKVTMAAGVAQAVAIQTDSYVITPSTEKVINYYQYEYIGINPQTGGFRDPEYYPYANDGTYIIEGIEDYQRHTIDGSTGYQAFWAEHCFDEATGEYYDFWLPYALYVPEDYHADGNYALVLHIHDAGSMSSDPMLTLTEAQGGNNYASDEVQQLAKDQGLDGAIVVLPAIAEMFDMDGDGTEEFELRMARDNWTLSCASQAIWKLMDSITDEYSIDMNRIYASGQSMGGMTVIAMAAQRDNYFAAILPMSCHWGSNFDKGYEFDGDVYYNAPADGEVIWSKDSDGNDVDYNNWYYLLSDDNMLYLNTEAYPEFAVLYNDILGVTIETAEMSLTESTNTTNEERSELIRELVSRDSDLGMYMVYLTGNVGHMSAWFYGHGTFACYEWLFSQTRESEMARPKLDLNNQFVPADEQLLDENHVYSTDKDGTIHYYPTAKAGSGTLGYNSVCTKLGSQAIMYPGWPDHTVVVTPAGDGN